MATHDVQAAQLRCSTTSLPEDQLPFGAPISLEVPLEQIVSVFLADTIPGEVAWADLNTASDCDDESRPADFVLPVWTIDVGASS